MDRLSYALCDVISHPYHNLNGRATQPMLKFGMNPDSKVHGANMGPIWRRQDPDGPHVGPMNFAIWEFLIHRNVYIDIIIHPCFQINDGLPSFCLLNKSVIPEHMSRTKFIGIFFMTLLSEKCHRKHMRISQHFSSNGLVPGEANFVIMKA